MDYAVKAATLTHVSRPRFCSCLIPVYATTIRTSTSGIAAPAERDTKRKVADEAAAYKVPHHTVARKKVVSVGRHNSWSACAAPVVDPAFFRSADNGSP